MRGLLNRGPSNDRAHDLIDEKSEEDPDKDFNLNENDLTGEWNVTEAEADAAWQKIQDEAETLEEGFQQGSPGEQHAVIANTEW